MGCSRLVGIKLRHRSTSTVIIIPTFAPKVPIRTSQARRAAHSRPVTSQDRRRTWYRPVERSAVLDTPAQEAGEGAECGDFRFMGRRETAVAHGGAFFLGGLCSNPDSVTLRTRVEDNIKSSCYACLCVLSRRLLPADAKTSYAHV